MSGGATLPAIATNAIAFDVTAGVPFSVRHGLGRQVVGWNVIWSTVHCMLHVADANADTSSELVLVPSASGSLRLVLF